MVMETASILRTTRLTATAAAFYQAGVTRQRDCPQVHARTSHARSVVFLFALAVAHPVSAADPQVIRLPLNPKAALQEVQSWHFPAVC
jgi:hypothetical protein